MLPEFHHCKGSSQFQGMWASDLGFVVLIPKYLYICHKSGFILNIPNSWLAKELNSRHEQDNMILLQEEYYQEINEWILRCNFYARFLVYATLSTEYNTILIYHNELFMLPGGQLKIPLGHSLI